MNFSFSQGGIVCSFYALLLRAFFWNLFMWVYSQSSGTLWGADGSVVATGYSGSRDEGGKNNPDKQDVPFVGPIPRGMWVMGNAYDSLKLGPLAMPLYPHGHDALDRTDFRVHGDSAKNMGGASEGCVVLARAARELMIDSLDRILMVIE